MKSKKDDKTGCFKCCSKKQVLIGAVVVASCVAVYVAYNAHFRDYREATRAYKRTDKEVFTKIYTVKQDEEVSITEIPQVEEHRPFIDYLQNFITEHNISTIVDMGCGYGELLKGLNLPQNTTYLGLDIVDSIIAYNKLHYERTNVSYDTVDDIKDLSKYKGDLLILKDVIQYWNNNSIIYAKEHILPNFKYAIIVNDIYFPSQGPVNSEIKTGDSRPLNLEISPFYMKLKLVRDYKARTPRIKRIYLYENNRVDSEKSPES
ncbi:MAG: hypothetical protein J6T29_03885 [Alphaproteobacteria bacterium]|nr:hypothetical protein [Alphaproteobacteria bacterium]